MTDNMWIWPLLPLDLWRQEIGYEPWHFWGLADIGPNAVVPVTSKCNDVVREYGWQAADEAGRDDIRRALQMAEKIFFDNVSYWPAPAYSVDTLPWPRYFNQRLARLGRQDARGGRMPIQLREGYIQNIGIEAFTVVESGAALVYTDDDGDGLKETFTITSATTLTEPTEIAAYFTVTDRLGDDDGFSARWRIEPLNIQITGGNAIIKGKRWLVVRPILYQDKDNFPIDPTVDANFITTCDVYRRYTYRDGLVANTDSQAALIWESRPCYWGYSTTSSSDPSAEGWVTARAGIRDMLSGIVTPAEGVYNATIGIWSSGGDCFASCSEPDKVLVRYLAGMNLDYKGQMFKPFRTIVSRLAAAELTRRICACNEANRELSNWQFDVSRVNAPEQYQINLDTLSNPLGTRRGHIFAWEQFKKLARVIGTVA